MAIDAIRDDENGRSVWGFVARIGDGAIHTRMQPCGLADAQDILPKALLAALEAIAFLPRTETVILTTDRDLAERYGRTDAAEPGWSEIHLLKDETAGWVKLRHVDPTVPDDLVADCQRAVRLCARTGMPRDAHRIQGGTWEDVIDGQSSESRNAPQTLFQRMSSAAQANRKTHEPALRKAMPRDGETTVDGTGSPTETPAPRLTLYERMGQRIPADAPAGLSAARPREEVLTGLLFEALRVIGNPNIPWDDATCALAGRIRREIRA